MKNNYIARIDGLCSCDSFKEASAEELRVLLTVLSLNGAPADESDIARLAGVSGARAKAALAFWDGCGILKSKRHEGIVEEFEERLTLGEIDEESSIDVAMAIRDENLASLIEECQVMVGTPSLPQRDVKNIAGLVSQYGMTPEYILTLAAYMSTKGELKIKRLCDHAISLQRKGVDNIEELEKYIDQKERGYEYEYRRVMGIYSRSLSKDEQKFCKKWAEDFGYSAEIISEAYNIAALNTGKGDFRYLDSILTEWHDAGCKTVSECLSHSESHKAAKQTEKKYAKSKPEAPRYGNFDVNEAFLSAVERSFGEKDED